MIDGHAANQPVRWLLAELEAEVVGLLNSRKEDDRIIEGRVLAVKASPELRNAAHLAIGVSALPGRYSTTPHSHPAEEMALVISGRGEIEIGDQAYPVEAGSVVLTPPNVRHVTRSANSDLPLVVLWVYAPPGSESRWLRNPQAHSAEPDVTDEGSQC